MLSFLVWGFAEVALFENFKVLLTTGDLRMSTSSDSVMSASIDACTGKVMTFIVSHIWLTWVIPNTVAQAADEGFT